MTCLNPDADNYFPARTFVLFLAVNLIFRIYYAVKALDGEDDFVRFVEKVTESDKSTVRHFLLDISLFFEKVDKKLLTPTDLINYSPHRMADLFDKNNSHLFSLFDLRESLEDETVKSSLADEEKEIYEQCVDLLERFEMTYICKFGVKEPFFVMFHVPMISYTRMIFRQSLLISDIIKLIESKK